MDALDEDPLVSDDDADVEALRLAALKSLSATKYINKGNLIAIVPVNTTTPIPDTVIKLEPISPTLEKKFLDEKKKLNEERPPTPIEEYETEEEVTDDAAGSDDDDFEKLMAKMEAEIEGKVLEKPKKKIKVKRKRKVQRLPEENEIELIDVKVRQKQVGPVINVRESVTPERSPRRSFSRSPHRRRPKSRSISPAYRRARSPLSPPPRVRSPYSRRSRSPYRSPPPRPRYRSRSPRSPPRARSPFRRSPYRSPPRSRSPWRSPIRRRTPSPRRSPPPRRRSPLPRLRSRSPLRPRNIRSPPMRTQVSPRRKSPSPVRKSPIRRRSQSPVRRRQSPVNRRRSGSPAGKKKRDFNRRRDSRESKAEEEKPSEPLDPVLEARRKKFSSELVVTAKKLSLKSIKDSTEPPEEDWGLEVRVDGNDSLFEDSDESDSQEGRFKCAASSTQPKVFGLSLRSLREGPPTHSKLDEPLPDDPDTRGNRRRGRERGSPDRRKIPDWWKNRMEIIEQKDKKKESPEKDQKARDARKLIIKNRSKNEEQGKNQNIPGEPPEETRSRNSDDFETLASEFEQELLAEPANAVIPSPEKPRIAVKKDLFAVPPKENIIEPLIESAVTNSDDQDDLRAILAQKRKEKMKISVPTKSRLVFSALKGLLSQEDEATFTLKKKKRKIIRDDAIETDANFDRNPIQKRRVRRVEDVDATIVIPDDPPETAQTRRKPSGFKMKRSVTITSQIAAISKYLKPKS